MASISNPSHFNETSIDTLAESNNVSPSPSAEPPLGHFVSNTGELRTIGDITTMQHPDNQAARADRATLANERWLEKHPEAAATHRPLEHMQQVPVAVAIGQAIPIAEVVGSMPAPSNRRNSSAVQSSRNEPIGSFLAEAHRRDTESLLARGGGRENFDIGHGASSPFVVHSVNNYTEEKTPLSPKEIIASTLNGVRNLETKLQGYNDDISSLIESAKSDSADPNSPLAQLPFYQALTPEEEKASIEDINNKKQQVADEVIALLSKSINGLQENLDQVLGQLNRTNLSPSEKSELQKQKQICEKGLVELRGKLENVKKLLASSPADVNYSIERFQSKLTSARSAVAGLAESLSQTGKDMAALQVIILLQQQQKPQQPDLNSNKNEVLVGSTPTDTTAERSADSIKTAAEQTKADDDNLNKAGVQSEKAADKKEATKQEQKALSEQKAALLAAEGLSVSNTAAAAA